MTKEEKAKQLAGVKVAIDALGEALTKGDVDIDPDEMEVIIHLLEAATDVACGVRAVALVVMGFADESVIGEPGLTATAVSAIMGADKSRSEVHELSGRLHALASAVIQRAQLDSNIDHIREMVGDPESHRGHGCMMDPTTKEKDAKEVN